MAAFFDNEEVGSGTKQGAASTFLYDVLHRIAQNVCPSDEDFHRAVASSFMFSADNAHAVHPNHPEYCLLYPSDADAFFDACTAAVEAAAVALDLLTFILCHCRFSSLPMLQDHRMSGETIDRQGQHADIHQRDGQAAECFRDGLAAQAVAGFRDQQHRQHIAKAAAKAKAKASFSPSTSKTGNLSISLR